MEKLYTQNKLPLIDPSLSADTKQMEYDQIKKIPAGFAFENQTLQIPSKPKSPLEKNFNRILKRSIDIFLSVLVITCVLSWMIPLMAILVKLDSRGPLFFLQKRAGLKGKIFTCIKFRTMIMNPQADLIAEQENDPRITRIGKFLRKHHIDELPQFINVLLGNMSIIGPRPYMIVENEKFEKLFIEFAYRNSVKPGITGFAQSNGNFGPTRDQNKLEHRLHLDNLYIQKWSPTMDAIILARTLRQMTKKA